MKENLTGLILSGLLHAGIIGWAANATYMPQKEKVHVQSHQLTVSLFQAEKIIKKPAVIKITPPAPSKIVKAPPSPVSIPAKKPVVDKPEPLEIIEPAKPIVVATIKSKPIIEKIQPVIKTETTKAIRQAQDKVLEKPVKKLKKTLKKIAKKTTLKNKKKRIKKPVKSKRKIIKKRKVVKRTKKRSVPKKTLKVATKTRSKARLRPKSRPKPKLRPKIKPKRRTQARTRPRTAPAKRKPVVRAQRRPRTAPVQRRVVRKAPVTRKIVKKGGVVNSIKSYKRASNPRKPVRQHAVRAHNRYKKPARQHHKSAPVKKASSVNSALIANLNKQYKAQLHRLIASATKKNYPKRAKRRNQQGRVRISFTISHSGTITNIKILKSSNIAVLDKAAIKTIQKTSHKLPFLSGMSKSSLHLTMTVAYVLR